MKTRSMALALALAAATFAPSAFADETTFCNAYITSLPYTITTQGHYCFNTNLSTAITTGDAITVDVDYVVLDLNNFKLGGGSAGVGTQTNGIRVNNHGNVTIRNGNIRGFYRGIYIPGGANARNNTVEQVTVDGNLFIGVQIGSPNPGAVVRRNIVNNTGGTTQFGAYTIGIWNEPSTDSITQDNLVSGTVPTSTGGVNYGIIGNGWVLRNTVTNNGAGTCFGNNATIYRDNNARACTTAYSGGTNGGGNYP